MTIAVDWDVKSNKQILTVCFAESPVVIFSFIWFLFHAKKNRGPMVL